MSTTNWVRGSNLSIPLQAEAKRRYVNRYTREHIPKWTETTHALVQFANDADWLNNTLFAMVKDGSRFNKRTRHCWSSPTWPR